MDDFSIFSYKAGNSFIHKIPAWIKVLFIPLFNISVFYFRWSFAAGFFCFNVILFFCLRFSIKEQYRDLKPGIFYAEFLYLLNFLTTLYLLWNFSQPVEILKNAFLTTILDKNTAVFVLKFSVCVQSCSLMFKTSTNLELREGIEKIELAVRRVLPCKKKAVLARYISLMIIFIPEVFKLWNQISRAWKARNGKNGLKMIMTLIPVLFSTGFKHGWNTSRAITIRQPFEED